MSDGWRSRKLWTAVFAMLLILAGFAIIEFAVPTPQRAVPWVRVAGVVVVGVIGWIAAYGPVIGPNTFVIVIAGVSLAIAGADYLVTRPTEPPGTGTGL